VSDDKDKEANKVADKDDKDNKDTKDDGDKSDKDGDASDTTGAKVYVINITVHILTLLTL
jgi:hypothetical protein